MKFCFNLLFSFTILLFIISINNVMAFEERIIAIVNDDVITLSEINSNDFFPQKSLSSLIEKRLLLQISKKKGITVQPAEISDALDNIKRMNSTMSEKKINDSVVNDLTEEIMILKLLNREINSKISINDKELEDYYVNNKDSFLQPESIRISYIYIPIKSSDPQDTIDTAMRKIINILSDLRENLSISEIQKRYTGNPQIYVSEDLGFLQKGNILPDLEIVAFSLKEGEISEIIRTSSGFYIIKMLERKKIEYRAFDDVKEDVRDALLQDKNERLYKDWLYNLKSSSYIKIFK